MGIKLGTSRMKRPHTDQMCQPLPPFCIPLPSSLCSHHVLAHLTPPPPPPTTTNSLRLKCLPYKLDYPWKTSACTAAKTAKLPCHCLCVMSILQ